MEGGISQLCSLTRQVFHCTTNKKAASYWMYLRIFYVRGSDNLWRWNSGLRRKTRPLGKILFPTRPTRFAKLEKQTKRNNVGCVWGVVVPFFPYILQESLHLQTKTDEFALQSGYHAQFLYCRHWYFTCLKRCNSRRHKRNGYPWCQQCKWCSFFSFWVLSLIFTKLVCRLLLSASCLPF